MPVDVGWEQISLRLTLTVIAAGLIGLDRGEHGRPAGPRTTILVSLAAAASMIQANLLLLTLGKTDNSFVTLDLMRLPLGVLSGMGFIGGGAILRRGNMVTGVTTAATLWFVTIMGLCFGGGQLGLGVALLVIGSFVLTTLRKAEDRMGRDRRATFILAVQPEGPSERQIRENLLQGNFRIISFAITYTEAGLRRVRCLLEWRARMDDACTPDMIEHFAKLPGVSMVDWRPG